MKNNEHVAITVRDNFTYKARRRFQVIACKLFGAKFMAKVYYLIIMKKILHLKKPETFTEKINWYKLYYCPNDELIIQCSDKFSVRSFLEDQGLGDYLSQMIGAWEDPDQICWDELPDKFALKNSNGCGYNIICSDKSYLDEQETKKLLKKWLKEHFGYYNAELHYEAGKKRILCESYIESANLLPIDYKIHCMNGVPKVLQICDERTAKLTKYVYYNMDGCPLRFGKHPQTSNLDISEEMLSEINRVCKKLAPFFPYVRIDFFVNCGKLQIGELTFTPSAGLKPDLKYGDGDKIMGHMLDLGKVEKKDAT